VIQHTRLFFHAALLKMGGNIGCNLIFQTDFYSLHEIYEMHNASWHLSGWHWVAVEKKCGNTPKIKPFSTPLQTHFKINI